MAKQAHLTEAVPVTRHPYPMSVADRLNLLSILPEQGDFVTLRLVRDLRMDLALTEDEMVALKVTVSADSQRVTWDVAEAAKAGTKDIVLGPKALTVISDQLKQMDAERRLTPALLGLYERFVEGA